MSGLHERSTTRDSRAEWLSLGQAGIGIKDLKYVVFYDKPLIKFERLLEPYLGFASPRNPIVPGRHACVVEREALSAKLAAIGSAGLTHTRCPLGRDDGH